MSAQTELAAVPPQETALAVYSAPNGLEPWLQQIRAEIDGFTPDISTRKGRDAIASMAYKVARSKTALDEVGKKLVADLKEVPKKIDAERKRVRDTLEAWQEEVRRPLNEWQAAEDARVDRHNDGIESIKALAKFEEPPTASHIAQVIADLELLAIDDSWEEFLPEAAQAKDQTLIALRGLLVKRQKEEAEQAELIRLRAEAEAREQKEREEHIAREAAERARLETEQKAQAEREAVLRREQEAKAAAEHRELQLKLQAEQAERARAQAEADRVAAEQRAEQERKDAARRAEEAVEQARLEERHRADAAAAETVRQQEVRERNEAHRRSINRAALDAFIAEGMPEECAKQAITLIAQRKIPNISISY
ncbi:hypothetical protein [Pseudomonas protegens]|uniref:hypothetical protein n=1 Tax=Pseudomonas protegens TaxID=380021 RepID=UPI000CD11E1C|nr:hypothetical protein [Pseudomonas protegens]POA88013.1 hypothetical protein C1883_16130 [Pseudomonas protegens]